jgi:hypothetical protein
MDYYLCQNTTTCVFVSTAAGNPFYDPDYFQVAAIIYLGTKMKRKNRDVFL